MDEAGLKPMCVCGTRWRELRLPTSTARPTRRVHMISPASPAGATSPTLRPMASVITCGCTPVIAFYLTVSKYSRRHTPQKGNIRGLSHPACGYHGDRCNYLWGSGDSTLVRPIL